MVHEEKFVEDLLLLMECSVGRPEFRSRFRLNHFNGAKAINETSCEWSRDAKWEVPRDAKPADVGPMMNYSMATKNNGTDHVTLCRVMRRTAKQMRGKIPQKMASFPLFEVAFGCVTKESRYVTGARSAAYVGGKYQVYMEDGRIERDDQMFQDFISACMGAAFVEPFHWHVKIGIDDGIRLKFHTDKAGASEIFRLRDVPPGKRRRAALRGWVTGHSRMRKDGSLTEVVRHMRGATEFHWNGLSVQLCPSESDMIEARRLKLARWA